jgi:hypothetical protein
VHQVLGGELDEGRAFNATNNADSHCKASQESGCLYSNLGQLSSRNRSCASTEPYLSGCSYDPSLDPKTLEMNSKVGSGRIGWGVSLRLILDESVPVDA